MTRSLDPRTLLPLWSSLNVPTVPDLPVPLLALTKVNRVRRRTFGHWLNREQYHSDIDKRPFFVCQQTNSITNSPKDNQRQFTKRLICRTSTFHPGNLFLLPLYLRRFHRTRSKGSLSRLLPLRTRFRNDPLTSVPSQHSLTPFIRPGPPFRSVRTPKSTSGQSRSRVSSRLHIQRCNTWTDGAHTQTLYPPSYF